MSKQKKCFCCKKIKEGSYICVASNNYDIELNGVINKRFVCKDCNHIGE